MYAEIAAIRAMPLAVTVLAALSLTVPARQPAAPAAAQPVAPAHLAGQDATDLTQRLQAFRAGTRVHEQRPVIAKTLSNTQVVDVAAYYNTTQIEVVNLPGQ